MVGEILEENKNGDKLFRKFKKSKLHIDQELDNVTW